MKVSHQQNILYKSRLNHERDSKVTKVQPSISELNKNINKTPLERASNEISFKGVLSVKAAEINGLKKLFYKITKPINLEQSVVILEENIGKNARTLLNSIQKDHPEKAGKRIIIEKVNGVEQIRFIGKRPLLLLWEGIKYPFTKLPQEMYYGTVKWMGKKNIISPEKLKKIEESSKVYKNVKNTVKFEEKFNALKGQIETADRYKNYPDAVKRAKLISDSAKMYDPSSGNYNTVHERALNRIVSGSIPAVFLANDAFNLSSLMDNDPKSAKKEHDLRFNQELKRVGSNAYVQLITLGALSRFINKSTLSVLGTTWLTFIATETYSRLSNGKPIHFITSEQAKEINAKRAAKEGKAPEAQPQQQSTHQVSTTAKQSFKSSLENLAPASTFKKLMPDSLLSIAPSESSVISSKKKEEAGKKPENKTEKPLLNADTLLKTAAVLLTAGYALKFARKKDVRFDKIFKAADEWWKHHYNKLTQKKLFVSEKTYSTIINNLKEGGYEPAAKYYEQITNNFKKSTAIKSLLKNKKLVSELENAGFFNEVRELSNFKKDSVINQNIKNYIEHLEKDGLTDLANKCKEIFSKSENKVNDSTYNKLFRTIKQTSAEKAEQFNSAFYVDDANELCKKFDSLIGKIAKDGELSTSVQTEIEKEFSKNKGNLYLGEIPNGYKTTVDFIVAPFKFIANTFKFPYLAAETIRKSTSKSMPKLDSEIKNVSNLMQKMPNDLKLNKTEFIKKYEDNIQKSFNKISMSGVSNSELSNIVRFSALMGTGWFLVADNYNMVMLKSNGENKAEAKTKRNERVAQEASRFFYTTMFITWFNKTFSKTYNKSLIGMSVITAACTLVGEYFTRVSIGIPVKKSSQKEIQENDYENINDKGARGHFFRFMSRLTGKKALSERKN